MQYQQEKKLLRQQASLKKLEKNETFREEEAEDLLIGEPDENLEENLHLNLESDENEDEKLKPDETNRLNSTKTATARANNSVVDKSLMSSNRPLNKTNQKWDEFNKNMNERAKQREKLKKERDEKRKQLELERLELLKGKVCSYVEIA